MGVVLERITLGKHLCARREQAGVENWTPAGILVTLMAESRLP